MKEESQYPDSVFNQYEGGTVLGSINIEAAEMGVLVQ